MRGPSLVEVSHCFGTDAGRMAVTCSMCQVFLINAPWWDLYAYSKDRAQKFPAYALMVLCDVTDQRQADFWGVDSWQLACKKTCRLSSKCFRALQSICRQTLELRLEFLTAGPRVST